MTSIGGKMIYLWQYNKATGYWKMVRECLKENAEKWLEVFQKDEPGEFFTLARRKPRTRPN